VRFAAGALTVSFPAADALQPVRIVINNLFGKRSFTYWWPFFAVNLFSLPNQFMQPLVELSELCEREQSDCVFDLRQGHVDSTLLQSVR
jgi:hypothetical protein